MKIKDRIFVRKTIALAIAILMGIVQFFIFINSQISDKAAFIMIMMCAVIMVAASIEVFFDERAQEEEDEEEENP